MVPMDGQDWVLYHNRQQLDSQIIVIYERMKGQTNCNSTTYKCIAIQQWRHAVGGGYSNRW